MAKHHQPTKPVKPVLQKTPTGIKGLDAIIRGGLPQGRTTLVCGGPGCGKTLLATEFLVRGALDYGEPGFSWLSRRPGRPGQERILPGDRPG